MSAVDVVNTESEMVGRRCGVVSLVCGVMSSMCCVWSLCGSVLVTDSCKDSGLDSLTLSSSTGKDNTLINNCI